MPGPPFRPGSEYRFLVGSGLSFAGIDQGIDFTGAGPVYALGDAVITRVKRSGSGWPGEGAVVNYKILNGAAKGKYVYVAEDFAPRKDLRVGMPVHRGELLGQATGSGRAPGIEVGWAQPSGIPAAPRPPARPADQYTPEGESFLQYVRGGGNVPAVTAGSIVGELNKPLLPSSVTSHIPGVSQAEAVAGFFGKITDPHNILRGLQVIAGAVLVLVGVTLLARQVGLAADIPAPPVPVPVPVP